MYNYVQITNKRSITFKSQIFENLNYHGQNATSWIKQAGQQNVSIDWWKTIKNDLQLKRKLPLYVRNVLNT